MRNDSIPTFSPPMNIYTKIASFRLQCNALTFMKEGIDI